MASYGHPLRNIAIAIVIAVAVVTIRTTIWMVTSRNAVHAYVLSLTPYDGIVCFVCTVTVTVTQLDTSLVSTVQCSTWSVRRIAMLSVYSKDSIRYLLSTRLHLAFIFSLQAPDNSWASRPFIRSFNHSSIPSFLSIVQRVTPSFNIVIYRFKQKSVHLLYTFFLLFSLFIFFFNSSFSSFSSFSSISSFSFFSSTRIYFP